MQYITIYKGYYLFPLNMYFRNKAGKVMNANNRIFDGGKWVNKNKKAM